MKAYFVRHGESVANKTGILEGGEGHLTDLGKEQAGKVGKQFVDTPIDIIVSSTLTRTRETTDEIVRSIDRDVLYSEQFVEWRTPSEMLGKHYKSEEAVAIREEIFSRYSDRDWHYSDEENFFDLVARADKAIKYLERMNEKNVLVVTHGFFMRVLIARMIFQEELTAGTFLKFLGSMKMTNAASVACEYVEKAERFPMRDGWHVVAWNG